MNRTTLSLIAATAVLAAVTGFAAATAPGGGDTVKAAARLPVERSSLLCPAPSTSDLADTSYTSFTPASKAAGSSGKAALSPATRELKDSAGSGQGKGQGQGKSKADKPVLSPGKPGEPVAAEASGAESPALVGTADGNLAPGWTVQQTTTVAAGTGRGLLGVNCSAPDTDFWFPGASTAKERSDYIHLTNPDDSAAVVDVQLYGPNGALKSDLGEGVQVDPHSSVPVLLSTLTDKPQTNLTLHVTARSGRVAATVLAADDKLGGDWLPASADPASTVVLPGIPKDATSVRLVAYAPGDNDADLKIQLASPSGRITPAGHESLHVKSGMTAAVDLGDVTRGEAGSLVLTPTENAVPVVAALQVVRGKGSQQEMAYIPATRPVGERATVADNRAKGSTLSLTAPGKSGTVRVTASAGTEGGTPVTKTYTVKGGTTTSVRPPVPAGLKGTYALTVEQVSGGEVYGSRMLDVPDPDVPGLPMFTVQTLPDDRGTVSVPQSDQDLSVLQK
ncbi:hypothetical protein EOT10_31385 [Streptomyces antnestii]|uniref:Secreted protein n=1 Tax=Streptomyces antnestii TaxID=2494256 RepID=A0A437P8D5_9ACTN|nr:DUF5719 family protein [Streptomyces sp. San01]RVU18533.1 hypothetical protein EOT10_31385 [Streptomyces sp. San01]